MTTTLQFRAERDTLVQTLSTAEKAVSRRGGMLPVLSGLKVEVGSGRLAATGSDLDLTITATCDVQSAVDGDAVFPAHLIVPLIRSLEPGIVSITVNSDNQQANIEAGRASMDLRVHAGTDYPRLGVHDMSTASTIAATDFVPALGQVIPAASTDDNRPIITGVFVTSTDDGLRLVATDSYRLALRDLPGVAILGSDRTSALVPRRAFEALNRAVGKTEKLSIAFGERDVTFALGNTTITSRLIEGEFPNYKGLIPASYPNILTVDRAKLAEVVGRVRLMARDAAPIRLHMEAGKITLRAVTQDIGEAVEEIDATYAGAELTVAFNPEYLAAGLESIEGDEATIETIDALKPAVLKATADTDYLYLLMPVRVS